MVYGMQVESVKKWVCVCIYFKGITWFNYCHRNVLFFSFKHGFISLIVFRYVSFVLIAHKRIQRTTIFYSKKQKQQKKVNICKRILRIIKKKKNSSSSNIRRWMVFFLLLLSSSSFVCFLILNYTYVNVCE